MCGFTGIFCPDGGLSAGERIELQNALALLRHRGPDGSGFAHLPNFHAGHARLAIIDLAGGHQPMTDPDTGVVLVFNGEIYNYIEARDDLRNKGYVFRTQSDTEVILVGYRHYGVNVVNKLNGMFSFVLYDPRDQSVHLVRDRFGEKPLYYFHSGDRLYFASELTALRAYSDCPSSANPESMLAYFAFGYIPGPASILDGVRQLPAAHRLTVQRGKSSLVSYYAREDLLAGPQTVSDEDIELSLARAVNLRMRADVPVATLLSGGLDSSLISVFAQRTHDEPIQTFSFGWKGLEDELPFAREVALQLGTEHCEIQLDPDTFLDDIDKVVAAMDMPSGDSAAFVVYQLCREIAARNVKVVLSGEGGDELFGGYPWYVKLENFRSRVKPLLLGKARIARDYMLGKLMFDEDTLASGFSASTVRAFIRQRTDETASYYTDDVEGRISYDFHNLLPWGLLPKVDRMSMAHSVEVRAPFLDPELVSTWGRLPSADKVDGTELKSRMKRLSVDRGLLPNNIAYRTKQGMNLPIAWWIRENPQAFRDTLQSERSAASTIFGAAAIQRWFRKLESENADGWSRSAQMIWTSTIFDKWLSLSTRTAEN